MPEGIIVASFGLRVKESSQQAIKSNPADLSFDIWAHHIHCLFLNQESYILVHA